MNWLVISITSTAIFICITIFILLFKKNSSVKLLEKNIKELKELIDYNIFQYEDVWISGYYGYFEKQIRFELTKNRLLNKCNIINTIICSMINLYNVDSKITKFYNEQTANLNSVISDIEAELENLSTINNNTNYKLSEPEKIIFNRLNNNLNSHITSFLIGNAKFDSCLKFYTNKKNSISYDEFNKKQRIKKIVLYIMSLIVSVGIGILVNYISKILGI